MAHIKSYMYPMILFAQLRAQVLITCVISYIVAIFEEATFFVCVEWSRFEFLRALFMFYLPSKSAKIQLGLERVVITGFV